MSKSRRGSRGRKGKSSSGGSRSPRATKIRDKKSPDLFLLLTTTQDELATASWWERLWIRFQLLFVSKPTYCHCSLRVHGMIAEGGYLGHPFCLRKPSRHDTTRLAVPVAGKVNMSRVMELSGYHFRLARYLGDVLGLRRNNWPPGSCVAVVAGLLDLEGRFRTPDQLLDHLVEIKRADPICQTKNASD